MADIATALVSGTFTVVASLGSVWLKDYLERRRQAPSPPKGPPGAGAPPRPSAPPAPLRAGSRLRPLVVALSGFVVGAVSSFVRPMFPGPAHPEAIASLVILGLIVLSLIAYHAKVVPGRGVALFELETLSLWAAFAFGWSVVHGSVWSDFVFSTLMLWLISAVAGLVLIPLVRRISRRSGSAMGM